MSTLEFTIIFHVFADKLHKEIWNKTIVHKRVELVIYRSHATRISSKKEQKKLRQYRKYNVKVSQIW